MAPEIAERTTPKNLEVCFSASAAISVEKKELQIIRGSISDYNLRDSLGKYHLQHSKLGVRLFT